MNRFRRFDDGEPRHVTSLLAKLKTEISSALRGLQPELSQHNCDHSTAAETLATIRENAESSQFKRELKRLCIGDSTCKQNPLPRILAYLSKHAADSTSRRDYRKTLSLIASSPQNQSQQNPQHAPE